MDKQIRNTLRSAVTQCRKLLEESVSELLQGQFGIHASGKLEDSAGLSHLSPEERAYRGQLVVHLEHIQANLPAQPTRGRAVSREAVAQLVREVAFTQLNRLAAYKLMERRGLIREAVSRGLKSQGFLFYLADHPADERLWTSSQPEAAYRHFLEWLGGTLSEEIGVLFAPDDPADRLLLPQRVLDRVLDWLNNPELDAIWSEDETIGWIYQYFTPKELREQARKESQAPRNSYELAFRNQFYTPRYVVEFLSDNTLGRTWYEMRRGDTALVERCRYLVRRKHPIFLAPGQLPPEPFVPSRDNRGDPDLPGEMWVRPNPELEQLSDIWPYALTVGGYDYARQQLGMDCAELANGRLQKYGETGKWEGTFEELRCCLFFEQRRYHHFGEDPEGDDLAAVRTLHAALCERWSLEVDVVQYRPKKDPRHLKILDPACGSGHFLLYCFDLLEVVYLEAYADPELGPAMQRDYATPAELQRALPGLILRHNLHGIDIDRRAVQIASLALWLRAQRAYQGLELKGGERPAIARANIVCAEPMPGDAALLEEFAASLRPKVLGQLLHAICRKMELAGEAGSLLKIEEEIREAVSAARKQWLAGPKPEQLALWPEARRVRAEQLSLFDLSDVTDEAFWQEAEGRLLEALEAYARRAENGGALARRLFAEDAARGFAFIDLCRQRYDVALMNPPFGEGSKPAKSYVEGSYPRSKNDVYAAFVERCVDQLIPAGLLGAITSRTGFFLSSFRRWREEILLGQARPTVVADLGYGVLDTAMVETAAYCLGGGAPAEALFLRLLTDKDKAAGLAKAIAGLRTQSGEAAKTFDVSPDSLRQMPGAPFAYWVSERIRRLFRALPPFESEGRTVKQGLATADDFRFVRVWWEAPSGKILTGGPGATSSDFRHQTFVGKRWVPFAKGGAFSPYYADLHLVVNWESNGEEIRNFDRAFIRNENFYLCPGLTWPKLPQRRGAFYHVPSGAVFSHAGMMLFLPEKDHWSICALLNSDAYIGLLHLLMPRGTGESSQTLKYEIGYVASVPIPERGQCTANLSDLARKSFDLTRSVDTTNETSHVFHLPALLEVGGGTLGDRSASQEEWVAMVQAQLATYQEQINDIAFRLYGIDGADRQATEAGLSRSAGMVETQGADTSDEEVEEQETKGAAGRVADLLSYGAGCAFGRWDVRCATGEWPAPELSDPFAPLPAYSPGMLIPGTIPDDYPLIPDVDGLLVDDSDHPDDIVRLVREVLELLWGERAEAIEREACDILGVPGLRDYFRRPAKGGFWLDHAQRYSKSRRKAPIYWLLQSGRKNYALWLYYHRLDKDLLFKALVNTVEPKLRLEEGRLAGLRAQRAAFGTGGREAKQLDREIERQEAFLTELEDFHEKLRRAADLGLEPDLNDGVVLNIAPLWELVPWKEARQYWEELLAGKYEWSSIGKQLREKGLIK